MEQTQKAEDFIKHVIPDAGKPDGDALANFRKAINAPSIPQVEQMITEGVAKWNTLNLIELKTPAGDVKLDDEPRHFLFPEILASVNAGIPTALVGPAGGGKSTVVLQVAKALELKFFLQNGVSGDYQLTGYMDAHGRYNGTVFRTAFELGGLFMLDEADTSDATALKWLNTAIAQGYATFPDAPDPVHKHSDFRVVMAANTFGTGADRVYVGANQLDASTLDRFVFIDFTYDEQLEMMVAGNAEWTQRVQAIRKAALEEKARVVISPRASINGSKLLTIGWTQTVVENRTIWKGMDPELRKRIEDKVPKVAQVSVSGLSWKDLLAMKRKEEEKKKELKKKYQKKHNGA